MRYLFLMAFAVVSLCRAEVLPASLFQDHAVLQQGVPLPVWGTAETGERVTVEIAGQTVSTVAKDGKWTVRLAPLPAGGPHVLTISGNNRIEITDVLIGEVWICGGQSNMERRLGLQDGQQPIKDWEAEAAASDFPQIRHFGVMQQLSLQPQSRAEGRWLVCSPKTAPDFTAVGYFFGRALHVARGTPIGLIHSSWGGTAAEAWTSRQGIANIPELAEAGAVLDKYQGDARRAEADFEQNLAQWFATNDPATRCNIPWSSENLDVATWSSMKLPQYWEKGGLADFDGVVWYRCEIDVPTAWVTQAVELHLGAIDDIDSTWINGQLVGKSTVWNAPRIYRVPTGTLKAGRNVIAVRVLDTGGNGGLWGGGDPMRLVCTADPSQAISLEREWRYKTSLYSHNAPPVPAYLSLSWGTPTVLYNGMIAPLQPYAIRGVIWYQGEANAGQAQLYQRVFPNLVADWRRSWGQGDFPFLYVQIAPFVHMPPEIREAQRLSLAKIPNAAMAVTLDVGDANDIHPADKKPVGERLALAARALVYGESIPYSGPLFASMEIDAGRAWVTFNHLGGGLVSKGGALKGFVIAGRDGVFHPADAAIVGERVEVASARVPEPVAVRYAWANVPDGNLFNQAGLPASPFATDSQ